MKISKLWFLLLLTGTVVSGCMTTHSRVPNDGPELSVYSAWKDSPVFREVQKKILIASPDSLAEARAILLTEKPGPDTAEALYVVGQLGRLLYPEIQSAEAGAEERGANLPLSSMYPAIFRSLEEGKYPAVDRKQAGIVTIMLASLSLLHAESSSTEEIAFESLRQLESMNTRSVVPPLLRGMAAERSKEFDQAAVYYEEALRRAPSCYPAALGEARLLYENGQYDRIVSVLLAVPKNVSHTPAVSALLAKSYFKNGNLDAADRAAEESLQLSPEQSELLAIRAEIAVRRKEWKEASFYLKQAEKISALDPDTRYLKALVLYRYEKKAGEALAVLDSLPPRQKTDAERAELYGKLLLNAGRISEAETVLLGVYRADPSRQETAGLLLRLFAGLEEYDAALEYIPQVLAASPDEEMYSLAYRVYLGSGQKERALAVMKTMYASFGKTDYLLEYVELLREMKRLQTLLSVVNDGLASTEDPKIRSQLFEIRSSVQQQPELRLKDLRSALYEDPLNTRALISLSQHFSQTKDYRKAYLYLRQASLLRPSDDRLKQELERLRKLQKIPNG